MNQSASGIFGSFQPPTSKSPSLPPGILGNGSQGVRVETGGPSPSLKLCVLKGAFFYQLVKEKKKKPAPPAVRHRDRLQNLNALQEFPPPAGFYPPRHPRHIDRRTQQMVPQLHNGHFAGGETSGWRAGNVPLTPATSSSCRRHGRIKPLQWSNSCFPALQGCRGPGRCVGGGGFRTTEDLQGGGQTHDDDDDDDGPETRSSGV